MSLNSPLGATSESGAYDVSASASLVPASAARVLASAPLIGRAGRVGGRGAEVRATRIGLVATVLVPMLGLFLCMAGTRTAALVPQTIQLAPPASGMAGLLQYVGFNMSVGEVVATLFVIVGAYFTALRYAEHVPARVMIGAVAAFTVVVLIGPPLFSTDMFSYQAYARMFAVYHINPYVHGPSVIQIDPLYPYIGAEWISTPSVYGPLFTFLSSAFAASSIGFSEAAFKVIAVAASGATMWLIWKSAQRRGVSPVRGIALFGLNPMVTLYGVGGGHNDLLMLALTMAGVYAVLLGRERRAGVLVTAAVAVKLTAAVVLPFALLGEPGRLLDGRRRRFAAGTVAVALVVASASYVAFGTGILHMVNTLQHVQDLGAWQSLPGFFFTLAHVGISHYVRLAVQLVLIGSVGYVLYRVWRGSMDWLDGAAWATLAVLLTAWALLPWYVCWLMPLVALSSDRRLWRAATVVSVMGAALMIAGTFPSWSWL